MRDGLFVIAGIAGLAGGVLSRSFSFSDVPAGGTLAAAVVIVMWFIARHVRIVLLCGMIAVLCFALGALRFSSLADRYDARILSFSAYEEEDVTFEATVVADPEERETGTVLFVEPLGSDVRIRVSTDGEVAIAYGDRVAVTGMLARPRAFESDLGRTFPFEEYLRARGVTHEISFADVTVVAQGEGGDPILEKLFAFKHHFALSIKTMLPEPHASLALGLVLGERQGLGERLEEAFRMIGIIHIVVLSGYNLTIIAEAFDRILARFLMPRIRAFAGAIAIVLFALMVGPSATVIRATFMALLVLYARASGRTYDALRALLFAGGMMVLVNPYVLAFDPGFQFSFLATFGLIMLGPHLDRAFACVPRSGGIREYVTATVATQIMVAPLLLYSIGAVSLIALLANVLILIAVPPAMLLVFLAGIIGLMAPFAYIFAYPAYVALAYILSVSEFLARIPFSELTIPPFPFAYVACSYVVLALILWYLHARSKTARGPLGPRAVAPAS